MSVDGSLVFAYYLIDRHVIFRTDGLEKKTVKAILRFLKFIVSPHLESGHGKPWLFLGRKHMTSDT
ncbi:UPF0182 protein alr1037 [Frankliniella fusca]|uniref:UPF0182 protein alr1037 n=1 Tax=Frankliniella fusca TaxID=407009 RepID=A0AAE1GZY3_9NEOP|nr:UPF0182 protein alr1037 [Frankliniella fusca]